MKRSNLFSISICMCMSVIQSCNSLDKNYDHYIQNSSKDFHKNKFRNAYSNADEAIRINPKKYTGFLLRGKSLYELDRINESLKDFKNVLKIQPENISAAYYVGLIYYDLDQFDSSIAFLDKAIASKGGDSIYIELDSKLLQLNFDENVSMAEVKYFRGLSLYYKKDYSLALDDFMFAANENFNKERCFFYVGLIALGKKNKSLACKYLTLSSNLGYKEATKYLPLDCP